MCVLGEHTQTHTQVYSHTLTRVYIHTHTHARARARGLGVSQRAPLIRVPASRSHNLRPTSPPARLVGPVARLAAARVYYAHTHARALTGCTRRQIITRVFFPSPPPLPHLQAGRVRFSKLILRPSGLRDVAADPPG